MQAPLVVDARALTGQPTGIGIWLREVVTRWAATGRPLRLLVRQGTKIDAQILPSASNVSIDGLGSPFHVRAARLARRSTYLSPDSMIVPSALGPRASVVVHDLAPLLSPGEHHWRARLAFRSLLGVAARRCAALIVPSQATRSDLLARYPDAAPRVHIVGEGPRRWPAPAPLPAGIAPPYLLFTGTLEPRKHVADLVEAFLDVAPDPWVLVLAGKRGWLSAAEAARLDRLRDSPRVHELGYVSDEVLAGLVAHADAVAYPSSYEGFGLPVLEGLAAGVAVLTTTAPALRELAEGAAVLVDLEASDPYGRGLRDAVGSLLGDPQLREHLALAGPSRAAAHNWDNVAEQVWEIVTARHSR